MEKQYKILILSNDENEEYREDEYIAETFRKDGHIVDLLGVDYNDELDEKFDIIIRRNSWVEEEEKTIDYEIKNNKLKERLKNKNIKTVNLEGFDGLGKEYLCQIYESGKQVIPTVDSIDKINKLPKVEEYVLKDTRSFGSSIGQKIVKAENVEKVFEEGYIIQPKLKFISEVQFYFIADKLMYVYEYTPNKYPDYPIPKLINPTEEEIELACQFAKLSGLKVGVQRIDFLRLEDNKLILLELEDNSPIMNLELLDDTFREKVLEEYKKNIYDYLEE